MLYFELKSGETSKQSCEEDTKFYSADVQKPKLNLDLDHTAAELQESQVLLVYFSHLTWMNTSDYNFE